MTRPTSRRSGARLRFARRSAARPLCIAVLCLAISGCENGKPDLFAMAPDAVCLGNVVWQELGSEQARCTIAQTSGDQPTERKLCELKADKRGPGYQILSVEDLDTHRIAHFADRQTYIGWLTYRAYCYMCHSDMGTGGELTMTSQYVDSSQGAGGGTQADGIVSNAALRPGAGAGVRSWSSADLVKRFRATSTVTLEFFEARVVDGIAECGMPPWKAHPVVQTRLPAVFAYLRARANNHLPEPASTFESFLRLLPSAPKQRPEGQSVGTDQRVHR